MFYTYVLKSLSHKTLYIGSSDNPEKRLEEEHNVGRVRYTKGRMPWRLIYKESYQTRGEAMKREKFLKSGRGRKFLDGILK
jgi:putative endonuclease